MAKNLRAIDQEVFSEKGRSDFTNREHGLTAYRIFELVSALIVVILGTYILVTTKSLMLGLASLAGGLILFAFAKQTERAKIVLERSEFLNALFASVVGSGSKFTFIATKKGQIVYLDNGFQKIFPEMVEMEKRSVAKLLTTYKVADAKKKSINEAVKKGAKKSVEIEIAKGKKKQKLKVSVEGIARPTGFVIIRGA